MARPTPEDDEHDSTEPVTRGELATRIFSIAMLGVFVVILLIIIMGDW
jgi:hypothetical protein